MNDLPAYGHWQLVVFNSLMAIMIGFLLQWPTLPTVIMFPFLVLTYFRLARREEQESLALFGDHYARYLEHTPRFVPKLFAYSIPAGRI